MFSRIGVQVLFIERGHSREDGYNESFNGELRDELPSRETFYTLMAGHVMVVAREADLE